MEIEIYFTWLVFLLNDFVCKFYLGEYLVFLCFCVNFPGVLINKRIFDWNLLQNFNYFENRVWTFFHEELWVDISVFILKDFLIDLEIVNGVNYALYKVLYVNLIDFEIVNCLVWFCLSIGWTYILDKVVYRTIARRNTLIEKWMLKNMMYTIVIDSIVHCSHLNRKSKIKYFQLIGVEVEVYFAFVEKFNLLIIAYILDRL